MFVISTTGVGAYTLNFTAGTFPNNGSFFIKNVDASNPISITFNSGVVSVNPTLYSLSAISNGYLCVGVFKAAGGGSLSIY